MPVLIVIFCFMIIGSFSLTSRFGKSYVQTGSAKFVKYTPSIFFLLMGLLFFYFAKREESLAVVLFALIGIVQIVMATINLAIALFYERRYHKNIQ